MDPIIAPHAYAATVLPHHFVFTSATGDRGVAAGLYVPSGFAWD